MNCNICGNPYTIGGPDYHSNCDRIREAQIEKGKRLDILLDLFKDIIDEAMKK